jgi:hypothetical protein
MPVAAGSKLSECQCEVIFPQPPIGQQAIERDNTPGDNQETGGSADCHAQESRVPGDRIPYSFEEETNWNSEQGRAV